ncbi:MAG: hypothetical protein IJ905_04055 [Fibrobacter sp.]|nr:hypothetical protein [Fibrobacter sp.]
MKIGLFTSVYFNNIGNGFIDLGAEATIKAAMPQDAEIVKLSQCANFAASMGRSFALKENPIINWLWVRIMQKFAKKLHDRSYSAVSTLDVFSPAKIAKLDYLILPGCIFTVPFFVIFGKLLEDKVAQGCKLIFLAASGNHYTENEVKVVSEWLEKLKPYAIMTRDSVAFKHYAKYSSNSYNGIDNVFFVNRLGLKGTGTTIDPYFVLNFDEPKHKNIKKNLEEKLANKHIVYTDHKPYPYSKVSKLSKLNVMCSDYPLDYLFIYKNVVETHSDRVHACIPTLSFGNRAQLYSDSPRIALFDNVGIDISEMKNHPVSLDQNHLKNLQDAQISFLKNVLK